jgi:succinyl-CoA synthetase beta subunit
LGGRVVVKAQILVAGRGKAGGVRVAENPSQAAELAAEMLGSSIKGERVQSVIVTPFTEIARELYLGFIVDRARRRPVMIASGEGGVDIEALAKTSPGNVLKLDVDPLTGLRDYQVRRAVGFMRLRDKAAEEAVKTLKSLYRLFTEMDCELAEINPLALTPEQRLVALDSKIILDDNALFRHREFTRPSSGSGLEEEARRLGFSAVELDGDIGIIGNGAGLTMATMDMVKLKGGSPANFLDVGGGAAEEVVDKAARLLLTHPRVKGVVRQHTRRHNAVRRGCERPRLRIQGSRPWEEGCRQAYGYKRGGGEEDTEGERAASLRQHGGGGGGCGRACTVRHMAILVDANTHVLVQGITGKAGGFPHEGNAPLRDEG